MAIRLRLLGFTTLASFKLMRFLRIHRESRKGRQLASDQVGRKNIRGICQSHLIIGNSLASSLQSFRKLRVRQMTQTIVIVRLDQSGAP
jgi:hypothetical protein